MPTEEELAKLRIAEEQQKIISSTNRTRKLKQRQLIGEQAEDVTQRKDHVEDAKRVWSAKGTEGQAHGADQIQHDTANKAKHDYATNLQKFATKGQPSNEDTAAAAAAAASLPQELKAKYDKPKSKMPSLFRKKNTTTTTTTTSNDASPSSSPTPKDKTAGKATNYAEEFYKIEKEEIKMVGTTKHVTITGIDQSGRRVTKTKIILPEQIGETKIQTQQKGENTTTTTTTTNTNTNNPLQPNNFNGQYYSLVDLRQRRVTGIDMNHREQYLSPEEFEKAFQMTKEAFAKLPKWKRDNLKRDLHLY